MGPLDRNAQKAARDAGFRPKTLLVRHMPEPGKTGYTMLRWVLTFLVLALVAGLLGFGGLAAGAAEIAKVIFYIFLVLLVISLLFGRSIWKAD
jgi:uncharacterized membrane protein YtjA (UPF0391 family)